MACQLHCICQNAIVANDTVVCDVHVRHQEAIAANDRLVFVGRPATDGDELPDHGIIANKSLGFFSSEFQVLWNRGYGSTGKNLTFFPRRAPSQITTLAAIQLPSPMVTFRCTVAKGSIVTLLPIFASG